MFTPLFTPRGEHSLLFRRMEERTENFTPRGQNSPLGDKIHPWGTTSPLGAKFSPRVEVKNGPLESILKNMYIWNNAVLKKVDRAGGQTRDLMFFTFS
jgi:hypothetical protein